MPLSLKTKLRTWAVALAAYDEEDYETALGLFSRLPKSSIILTNMGLIYAALGEHEAAVDRFIQATLRDPYLAVAYFQCGVSNFLLARYDLAYRDFREALRHLRNNQTIDYEQLGLAFKLYPFEVLFNRGLCLIALERPDAGLADLRAARKLKASKDHEIVEGAIWRRGDGYMVFSIPRGTCYRPSVKKLVNAGSRDYMGEAKLIAALDIHDTSTGFSGVERLQLHRYFDGNVNWRSASAEEQRPETETDIDDARSRPVPPRGASINDATRGGVRLSLCLLRPSYACMRADLTGRADAVLSWLRTSVDDV
ncbi:P-type phospholipid transporter [Mycena venus]|uniref:P-type phospholipid transporter n=1 Tax=Mycena venus TaxID=2733690 RepID=A0A8H6XQ05_9AGAR|nr:P-type phospholipid transporter [Mycena venus]